MSNYNKATNFAVKDTLTSGDPDKVVSGAEIDNEFDAISSAVRSKADKVSAATTNNLASLDANGNLKDSNFPANATVPSGGIIMWSGLISAIPTGWSLCDGTNGTPDLRNRFIVGAGDQYNRNDTGGQDSVQLTENEMPSHNHSMNSSGSHSHSGSTDTSGDHRHDIQAGVETGDFAAIATGSAFNFPRTRQTATGGAHSHSLNINSNGDHTHSINNTGGDGSHENRPPYYALAFIMKT